MSNQKKHIYNAPSLTIEDLSRALYDSNLKLNSLMKERDEFFANISHDLRSPIAAIRSSVEFLQSTNDLDDAKRNEIYTLIDSKTKSLEYMINEIFLLTKLSTKDDMLHPEIIPCGFFLEEFFFTNQPDSKFDKANLKLDVPLDLDCNINIDPHYFERVLNNLFDNALRHLYEGGHITLSAQTDDNNRIVLISVIDDGEGISDEDLPKIFDRSYMGNSSRTPGKNSGAGLGLSICHKIIELSGGSIRCTSKTGRDHGTIFTITLPVCDQ